MFTPAGPWHKSTQHVTDKKYRSPSDADTKYVSADVFMLVTTNVAYVGRYIEPICPQQIGQCEQCNA